MDKSLEKTKSSTKEQLPYRQILSHNICKDEKYAFQDTRIPLQPILSNDLWLQ